MLPAGQRHEWTAKNACNHWLQVLLHTENCQSMKTHLTEIKFLTSVGFSNWQVGQCLPRDSTHFTKNKRRPFLVVLNMSENSVQNQLTFRLKYFGFAYWKQNWHG